MQVFHSLEELATHPQPSVVTIGNFDGVHRGHRMVIDAVIARASELSAAGTQPARSIAVTFDPHPARVIYPEADIRLITPLDRKLELLAATGLDATLVLPFTPDFAAWTAQQFAARVLHDALHAIEVHEGETFRFGHEAAGNIMSLTQLGQVLNFSVRTFDPLVLRGVAVSSSRIRGLIAAGNVSQARALLGRPFAVRSTPAPGRGYGTRYTVPTINLAPYTDLLPANGVYITTLRIGNPTTPCGPSTLAGPSSPTVSSSAKVGSTASRTFRSVTNCGNRPTFAPGGSYYALGCRS